MDSRNEHLSTLLATNLNHAFERLVLTYQDQLYTFALLKTCNSHAAQEIVQSALERAYYTLKNYSSPQIRALKLEPWLYEITRNVFYNYTRANHIRPPDFGQFPSICQKIARRLARKTNRWGRMRRSVVVRANVS